MKKITVLYDGSCSFCLLCRDWLLKQPAYIEVEMIPRQSIRAQEIYPNLVMNVSDELVVVDDEGGVYRGDRAFIICLYGLKDWREWAIRLAKPHLRPLAARMFKYISLKRKSIANWIPGRDEQEVEDEFERLVIRNRNVRINETQVFCGVNGDCD